MFELLDAGPRSLLAALLLTASSVGALHAQDQRATLERFLRQDIALTPAQLDAAMRGSATVKVLETTNPRDVAIFGIVALGVSRETYTRRLRDFPNSLRAPTRTRLGFFGTPPAIADVRDVSADRDAIDELRKCRPGQCNFKMPAADMARVRELLGGGGDARAAVSAYVRQRMVEYAADYRARGNAALVIYDDRGGARASDAFADLLRASPYLYRHVPLLHDYLRSYPSERPPGATDALAWWQDEMPGLRPVLSITHMTLYEPPEIAGVSVMAAKQLYANHYFEAAFDLLTVIDRDASAGGGSYLLILRRYRFDNLPSGGLLNIRGRVVGKLREAMQAELARATRG